MKNQWWLAGLRRWRLGLVLAVGVILAAVLIMVLAGGGDSDENGGDALMIVDPWVRATIPMAEPDESAESTESTDSDSMDSMDETPSGMTTAAFMTIENPTATDERLIAAAVSTEIAGVVEIHETTMGENDVMVMQPVDGIDVPAGGRAELKPRGLHIMLMDVKTALNEGDTVTITLTFESGLALDVVAEVRPLVAE